MNICADTNVTSAMVKVILVDDHEFARQGIRKFLDSDKSIEILGEASTYFEAVTLIEQHRPDVLLLDIRLKEGNGIDVAKFVKANVPQVKILVLTAHNDDQYVKAMVKIGVNGYLIKTISADQLRRAIHDVAEGNLIFPAEVSSKVISLLQSNAGKGNNRLGGDIRSSCRYTDILIHNRNLNTKETRALDYMACDTQNPDTTTSMGIAVKTVEGHMRQILRKFGAKTKIQTVFSENMSR